MARKIVITSGKGGVGKTTIVSSLGIELAKIGYKVMLIDMDFGLNNLDVVMGIENKIVYDIIDVLEGKCLPRQALIQDFFESNLYIFPSSHSFCKIKFGAKELMDVISQLDNLFDYILIDCPAGIDGGFKRAVECGMEHIVVTTPHISAIRDADKVARCLYSNLSKKPSIIINRARGDLILSGDMLNISIIRDSINGDLIGVVPEDDAVSIQMYKGIYECNQSDSQKAIAIIARNIINGQNNLFDCTQKYKGLIGSIRKTIKRRV